MAGRACSAINFGPLHTCGGLGAWAKLWSGRILSNHWVALGINLIPSRANMFSLHCPDIMARTLVKSWRKVLVRSCKVINYTYVINYLIPFNTDAFGHKFSSLVCCCCSISWRMSPWFPPCFISPFLMKICTFPIFSWGNGVRRHPFTPQWLWCLMVG